MQDSAAVSDPRPRSAVSHGVGLVGLAGLLLWTAAARAFNLTGPGWAVVALIACAVPMVLWSLLVDKVHLNPSTGIDWSSPRAWRDTVELSLTKLAAFWVTWVGIATIYFMGRFYWTGNFAFAMWCFTNAAPINASRQVRYRAA